MKLPLTYTIFAVIAILTNIGAQDVSIRLYADKFGTFAAMLVGTAAGLMVKYLLDKKYIFQYRTGSLAHDVRAFAWYSFMGVFTTLIFWGSELGFDFLFESRWMRYTGAVIGLAAGYWLKYHLDKRYVFV